MHGYWKSGVGRPTPLRGGYIFKHPNRVSFWRHKVTLKAVEMDENGNHTPPETTFGGYIAYRIIDESSMIACLIVYDGHFDYTNISGQNIKCDYYFNGIELIPGEPTNAAKGNVTMIACCYLTKSGSAKNTYFASKIPADVKQQISNIVTNISSTYSVAPMSYSSRSGGQVIYKLNTRYASMSAPAVKSTRAVSGAYSNYDRLVEWCKDNGYLLYETNTTDQVQCYPPGSSYPNEFYLVPGHRLSRIEKGGVIDYVGYPLIGSSNLSSGIYTDNRPPHTGEISLVAAINGVAMSLRFPVFGFKKFDASTVDQTVMAECCFNEYDTIGAWCKIDYFE